MKKLNRKQKWMWVIGTVVVLCNLAFPGLRPLMRRMREKDLAGATEVVGTARLETLVVPRANMYTTSAQKPWATVRLNGELLSTMGVREESLLKEGDMALVRYRTGKSGKIYVDSVEPLQPGATPSPKPHTAH